MRAVVSQAYIAIHKARIVIQIPLFDAINPDKFRFLTKYEIKYDELHITFDSPELIESRLGVSECKTKSISEGTLV